MAALKNELAAVTSLFASRIAAQGGGCLAQIWTPQPEADGSISLSTQGQPFSVSGVGDLLALFRCVSCRYRFSISAPLASGSLQSGMGSIGRVFASGEPEMSHNVQDYPRNMYMRVGEARRCRVHASLFMPLFTSASRDHPVAVFEVAQAERDVLFPALIDILVSCLQATGLHTADITKHAMTVGLHAVPGDLRADTPDAQHEAVSSIELHQPQTHPSEAGPQPLATDLLSASPQAQSEAGAASPGQVPGSSPDRQQAASGNRSANNSSDSIQPPGKRARTTVDEAAASRGLSRGSHVHNVLNGPSCRSQRLSRKPAASILSAGSSELTAATEAAEQSGERPLGAGKRLTLEQLQAQFGVGLKEAAFNLGICPTTLKRACRRHGIARWPRRPALRPAPKQQPQQPQEQRKLLPASAIGRTTAGMPLSNAAVLSAQSTSLCFDMGSASISPDLPLGGLMHTSSSSMSPSNGQVVVLPELPGWPAVSHYAVGSAPDGIAHLLPGDGMLDMGSGTHDMPMHLLDALPTCGAVGGLLTGSHARFDSVGHSMLPIPLLCQPQQVSIHPGSAGAPDDPGSAHGAVAAPPRFNSALSGVSPPRHRHQLHSAEVRLAIGGHASQPLPFDQGLPQEYAGELPTLQPLPHTEGLSTGDNGPVVDFPVL